MSFSKKTWKNRVTQFPTKRKLIHADETEEIVEVERAEGTVTEEGDVFSAGNMNDLENRIQSGINDVFIEQGTVTTLNFTGLATGRYICSFSGSVTGAPTNNDGMCITTINSTPSYGGQTVISDGGHFYRKLANGSWGAWEKMESTASRVTSVSSASDNNHYPTAKAVFDVLNIFSASGRNVAWKTSGTEKAEWFFYEGASSSTYDLPSQHCFILVFKQSNVRGFALALDWANGANPKMWYNNLHDSWHGWTSLH